MAQTFAKSFQIQQVDQSIFAATNRLSIGQAGPAPVYRSSGFVLTQSATDVTTIFYRMVRLPPSATITKVGMLLCPYTTPLTVTTGIAGIFNYPTTVTVTTFSINVGIWASDVPANDVSGAPAPYQLAFTAISDSFFAYAYTGLPGQPNTLMDLTFQNSANSSQVVDGYYHPSSAEYQLWDAVQNGGQGRTSVVGYSGTTKGVGYSSGTTSPWTSPANSGTVLLNVGNPGGYVDIGFRHFAQMSASAPVLVRMDVDYRLGSNQPGNFVSLGL